MVGYHAWKEIKLQKYLPGSGHNAPDKECAWGVVEQADDNWAIFLNTPGGMLAPEELQVISGIMKKDGLQLKLTGRQAPVLLVPEEKVAGVLEQLDASGLKTAIIHGSLRNVKACMGKGYCKNSHLHDVQEIARAIDTAFYGVKLPGDFKIAISGCSRNCAAAKCQCLGLVDSRDGFTVYLGGAENEPAAVHGTPVATGVPGDKIIAVVEAVLKGYIYIANKLSAEGVVGEKPRLYELLGRVGTEGFSQALGEVIGPEAGKALTGMESVELELTEEIAATLEDVGRLPGFTKENAFRAFIVLNQLCIHCAECQRSKCQVYISKETIVEVSRTGHKFLPLLPPDMMEVIRSLPVNVKNFDVFKLHEAFHAVAETCDSCREADHDYLCAVNIALTAIGCLIKGRDYETNMDKQKRELAK